MNLIFYYYQTEGYAPLFKIVFSKKDSLMALKNHFYFKKEIMF